jgi:hypothetical protein
VAAPAAATRGELLAELSPRDVLLVENVERRQADVGDLFLAERYLGRHQIQPRLICCRHGSRVSAARQRQ